MCFRMSSKSRYNAYRVDERIHTLRSDVLCAGVLEHGLVFVIGEKKFLGTQESWKTCVGG